MTNRPTLSDYSPAGWGALGGMNLIQSTVVPVTVAANTVTATLPTPPVSGRLLFIAHSIDKAGTGSPSASSGWTLAASYFGVSVSLIVAYRIADGTAADQSCTLTWTTAQRGECVIAETDVTGVLFAEAGAFPSPVDDLVVTSVTGSAGVGARDGVVLAFGAIDTATTGSAATWTNSYVGLNTQATDPGVAIAGRVLLAGDSSSVTHGWNPAKSDQYALVVARFEQPVPPPPPPPPPSTYTFNTPYNVRAFQISGALWGALRYGRSVMRIDGEWVETEFPTYEQEQAADLIFTGGGIHIVDQATADALTAAGYEVTLND